MPTITFKQFLKYLNELSPYNPQDGYVAYSKELLEEAEKQQLALTYGEILPKSLNTIIQGLDIDKHDVFYDLGSGTGKVALQFCLTTPIQKSYGIEALEVRHTIAEKAYINLKQQLPELFIGKHLESIHDNFLTYNLENPTVIFTDSLCFTDDTIKNLTKILNNIRTIKYVISLKQMKLKNLKLKKELTLQFSWSMGNTTKVYIYEKSK